MGTYRLFLLSAAVLCGLAALNSPRSVFAEGKAAEPRAMAPRAELGAEEKNAIGIFQNTSPSVVYVTSLALAQNRFSLNVYEIPKGTGSGFVWDSKGHIVTNYHVIEDANKVEITLVDGSKWKAILVGAAPDKDLAVLKISAPEKSLKPIAVGDSKNLLVGQKVYAIGNPFGLDYSMTSGMVSALGREIKAVTGRTIHGLIQTDAAINPGNSGGPLLDSSGRLIGINTAIYSPSGASAGISFAVPVEVINRVAPDLIAFGRVERPGIGISAARDEISARLGIEGVLITRVQPGTPAEKAKLRETYRRGNDVVLGDVIVSVNGEKIRNTDDLFVEFDAFRVGQTVSLGIRRGNETIEVRIKLEDIN